MSSAETDRRDRRQRERQADANLAETRAGKSRIRDMADAQQQPSHRPSKDLPNTSGGGR
jgi:hypothetical protein